MQSPTAVFLSVSVVSCLAAFYLHPDTSLAVIKIMAELIKDGFGSAGQLLRATGGSAVGLFHEVGDAIMENLVKTCVQGLGYGFEAVERGFAHTGDAIERAAAELVVDVRRIAGAFAIAISALWEAASLKNTSLLVLLALGTLWLLPPISFEIIDKKGHGVKAGMFREEDELEDLED